MRKTRNRGSNECNRLDVQHGIYPALVAQYSDMKIVAETPNVSQNYTEEEGFGMTKGNKPLVRNDKRKTNRAAVVRQGQEATIETRADRLTSSYP